MTDFGRRSCVTDRATGSGNRVRINTDRVRYNNIIRRNDLLHGGLPRADFRGRSPVRTSYYYYHRAYDVQEMTAGAVSRSKRVYRRPACSLTKRYCLRRTRRDPAVWNGLRLKTAGHKRRSACTYGYVLYVYTQYNTYYRVGGARVRRGRVVEGGPEEQSEDNARVIVYYRYLLWYLRSTAAR